MNLRNYNYGHIPAFECVIRGKITMSMREWLDVQMHIFKPAVLAKLARECSMTPEGKGMQMREDMERKVFRRHYGPLHVAQESGFYVNIGTTATREIVKQFRPTNAKKIKLINYMIHVTQ